MRLLIGAALIAYPGADEGVVIGEFLAIEKKHPPTFIHPPV